jgi:hypothetical protein
VEIVISDRCACDSIPASDRMAPQVTHLEDIVAACDAATSRQPQAR